MPAYFVVASCPEFVFFPHPHPSLLVPSLPHALALCWRWRCSLHFCSFTFTSSSPSLVKFQRSKSNSASSLPLYNLSLHSLYTLFDTYAVRPPTTTAGVEVAVLRHLSRDLHRGRSITALTPYPTPRSPTLAYPEHQHGRCRQARIPLRRGAETKGRQGQEEVLEEMGPLHR